MSHCTEYCATGPVALLRFISKVDPRHCHSADFMYDQEPLEVYFFVFPP